MGGCLPAAPAGAAGLQQASAALAHRRTAASRLGGAGEGRRMSGSCEREEQGKGMLLRGLPGSLTTCFSLTAPAISACGIAHVELTRMLGAALQASVAACLASGGSCLQRQKLTQRFPSDVEEEQLVYGPGQRKRCKHGRPAPQLRGVLCRCCSVRGCSCWASCIASKDRVVGCRSKAPAAIQIPSSPKLSARERWSAGCAATVCQ